MTVDISGAAETRESHVDAAKLLRQRGVTVLGIIRVNPEAILYLGSGRRVMTAWVHVDEATGRVDVRYEPGMPAEPSFHLSMTS